jgi:hypothetical protein
VLALKTAEGVSAMVPYTACGTFVEIKAGFADPAFSPVKVALKLGLSPRYLQDLLAGNRIGLTERALELRLQKACTMLENCRDAAVVVHADEALPTSSPAAAAKKPGLAPGPSLSC